MSFHINSVPFHFHRFLRERRPLLLLLVVALVKSKSALVAATSARFGMNGGNSRTINDNYGALAAIRNT